MRAVLLILLCSRLALAGGLNGHIDDVKADNLKGKVCYIISTTFKSDNENNNQINRKLKASEISNISTTRYNKKGIKTQETSLSSEIDYDKNIPNKWKFELDEYGNKKGCGFFHDDELLSYSIYRLEEGEIIKEDFYDRSGEFNSSKNYSYDNGGNVQLTTNYDKNGDLGSTEIYSYKDLTVEKNIYGSTGIIYETTTTIYNEIGDPIKQILEFKMIPTRPIKVESTYKDYVYDKVGNWIRRTVIVNNEMKTEIRKIDYCK